MLEGEDVLGPNAALGADSPVADGHIQGCRLSLARPTLDPDRRPQELKFRPNLVLNKSLIREVQLHSAVRK